MEKIVIKAEKVSKKFNIYRKSIHKVAGLLFGKEPPEVKHALDNINLTVRQGEKIAIMGEVESGRTTLLTVISGIISPSKGKVEVNGSMNIMLNAKAGMEMEFTCRENIYTKANVVGISPAEIKPNEEEILDFAEATEYANLAMTQAPKGTPMLMSLAEHLLLNKDILIVDEVFGGGGGIVRSKCEKRLEKYLNDNPEKTLLIVTGKLSFIKNVCNRVIVMDSGKIAYDGHDIEEAEAVFKEINFK